jgi:glycosyltransferase involved in cell wall biosynthesis
MQTAYVYRAHPATFAGASAGPAIRLALCTAGEIWGGIERFVLTLAPGLRAAGIDPLVILFHDALLARQLRAAQVRVEVLDGHGKYDPRTLGRLRRLLRERHVDVLHVHGYKATIAASLAARGLPVRIVKTEHGLVEPFTGWRGLPAYSKLVANVGLDRMASRYFVDASVFVSRDLHDQRSAALRGSRRVIYNGIDVPSGPVPEPRQRPGTFAIGIVGRIDTVKGHLHLLEALARLRHLPDIRLHVFGEGPLEETCRRLCRALGLASRVSFEGFQPAIQERMAELDLLVMPSLHEGLPYVLLEAMALKIPVVASRVGGIREAMERDDCGLLVAPGDPVLLANAIERVYRNSELRLALARRGHDTVHRRFLASRMVGEYVDLYRELVGN